jgi:transcriptional regulator with XRE-family HTH domain
MVRDQGSADERIMPAMQRTGSQTEEDEERHRLELNRRKELGKRIKAMREAKPGMTQTKLGLACGWHDHQYIQKIENGDREVKGHELVKIAQALDTDPASLVGEPAKRRQVSYFGDVGRGGEYFAHAGSGRWMEISKVDAPIGDERVNASVRIVGNHLEEAGYLDGDMLFFCFPGDAPDEIVGKRCMVQLRGSSEALLGVLTPGSRPGKYWLRPLAPGLTSREVSIEWAARIRWHQCA